ncbi:MAG: hypothetical protein AAFN27_05765 [Pseudomonadota bacterium]
MHDFERFGPVMRQRNSRAQAFQHLNGDQLVRRVVFGEQYVQAGNGHPPLLTILNSSSHARKERLFRESVIRYAL